MKVLVSGSTGLVGMDLLPFLSTQGHEPRRLVRSGAKPGDVTWNPDAGSIDAAALEGLDAVVHLAGDPIAAGRWNAAKKARIRDSRVRGTALLAETLAKSRHKPKVLICASAVGYYGNRGDEECRETSAPGNDFLAGVCRDWEVAAQPARDAGIRVVHLRIGMIVSGKGGALGKMLTPFKLGLGGRIGAGTQWMSWVAVDDVLGAIGFAMTHDSVQGPVNLTAPNPVRNVEFTRALAGVLHRPAIFPMPAFAARLAFGEMADALLLSGQRVLPERLPAAGYRFLYPELTGALKHVLGR